MNSEKKTKKNKKVLKGVLKNGNKKTKKNLKVNFEPNMDVIKYHKEDKANVKNKIKKEPIINKTKKKIKNEKIIKLEYNKYKKVKKNKLSRKGEVKKENYTQHAKDKYEKQKKDEKQNKDENNKKEKKFKEERKGNVELHPNEIKLQGRNNVVKKKMGIEIKEKRFINKEEVKKKSKKEKVYGYNFKVFSWDVIMLLGALIAPIYVYNDMVLNI